jgi:hypothetical protein
MQPSAIRAKILDLKAQVALFLILVVLVSKFSELAKICNRKQNHKLYNEMALVVM